MWNQRLIWLHVITDSLVALSYYSIPAALFVVATKRKNSVPVRPLLLLFGLFIAFCGAGHVMDIVSIWRPIYWLKGFWNAGTALTSVVTALVLIPQVAEFVSMPERTEALRREKALLEEKHGVLQAVLESVSEGILLVNQSGLPLTQNLAAREILGTAGHDGRILPVDWPGHATVDHDIQKLPDGRVIERSTKAVPGFGQLYVLQDITERLRSEELRRRLEFVVRSVKQGFALVSFEEGEIQMTNPSMAALHGYREEELIGKNLSEVFAGTPEEQQNILEMLRELSLREKFWEGEFSGLRKDHSTFPSWLRVNLHQDGEQRFLSLSEFDITEQKQTQAETAKLQDKLRQKQKLESLGVLAGGVAHDFNNLLTGIMGNTSLALDLLASDNLARPQLEDVLMASERAAALTKQLLAYSGKGRFVIKPLNLSQLMQETQSLVKASVPRTVQLQMHLRQDLPYVEADPTQMQQLMMNLVINAAEAIGEKPGIVQVTTGTQTLEEQDIIAGFLNDELKPGQYVYVEVQDNGCGMSEQTKAQIFDPFFTTKFTGRGLGLAAALGIIRGHKGTLKVYSELGLGSTFKVYLPAWQGEKKETQKSTLSKNLHGSGTVLVVDDEDVVRNTTASTLRRYGYHVLLAHNGLEGIEMLTQADSEISLVLLDLTMPVMSGEEALRHFRRIRPYIPIILTSGFNESEAVQRLAGDDFSGFLQKPYTSLQLAEIVKKAMA